MPTATRKKPSRKPTLSALSRELSWLRARVDDLEDLRDLNAAVSRYGSKLGIAWDKAKAELGLT